MTEENMVHLAQAALDHLGIDDTVVAVGQFQPRGRSGGSMAGGLIGSELGEVGGSVGEGIGLGAGMIGGSRASSAASGLPVTFMVAVSASTVYGLHARSRKKEPDAVLFQVARGDLTAVVHQRVNVRTLELIEESTGRRIELEGSRIPVTHSKDIMDILTAASDAEEQPPD